MLVGRDFFRILSYPRAATPQRRRTLLSYYLSVWVNPTPPLFTTRLHQPMAAARYVRNQRKPMSPCTSASVGGGLFLLISLLYIRFILRVGPLGPFDAVIEPPEPPLCLLTGGPALVVALPLLEQTAAAASAALAERLEQWQGTPPCRRDDGAATLSLVLNFSSSSTSVRPSSKCRWYGVP